MSPMLKALPLIAALAGTAASAQTAPGAAPAPTVQPETPQPAGGCPMRNGQRMMDGQAMGAHMRHGRMVDKDGKPIMGGMMGAKGMMCVPMASANAEPRKATPKAEK